MAASRVDELKDDFLTCPLCLQLFTKPKVLACQHTFCLSCLQGYLAHNKFPFAQCLCPLCKEIVRVPEGDAAKLKNNFLVVGLLQFVGRGGDSPSDNTAAESLPAEPPGAECSLCEETRPCTEYCLQCQLWMCVACKRSHSKVPATKSHTTRSLQDLHSTSLEQLQMMEGLMQGLEEEADTCQAVVFGQRQMVSDQMCDAERSINAAASRLQAMVVSMQEKLLSQLYDKLTKSDDVFNKALGEVEGRKGQLDRVRNRVKTARSSTDLGEGMRLVGELQRDLRQLCPLPSVPSGAVTVSFHPAPLLLPSLEADSLGCINSLDKVAAMEKLRFPADDNLLHFTTGPHVQHSSEIGLVSSLVVYGSAPEKVIFVAGNNQVCSCPPRLQFGLHNFQFAEMPIFHKPWGVALTCDQRVLVTDAGPAPGEGFVAVCGLDGNFVSYLAKGLSMPRGIAIGSNSLVYVCDQEDRCVYALDYQTNGTVKKVLKKDAEGKFLFFSPMDVAVAGNGDIIVCDAGQTLKIFSRNFVLKKTYHSPLPKSELWGVCTHPGGRLFVADWRHGIHVLSNSSDAKFEGLLKGMESAGILEPSAVAFNMDSAALLVGNSSSKIYRSVYL